MCRGKNNKDGDTVNFNKLNLKIINEEIIFIIKIGRKSTLNRYVNTLQKKFKNYALF